MLSDLLSREVAVNELFAGEGRAINNRLSLDLGTVHAAFCDGFEVRAADLTGELERLKKAGAEWAERRAISEFLERRKHWPKSLDSVPAGLQHDVYRAMSDSDLRMCKNIGADRDLAAAAMAKLWRKTFTARRDELAGADANPQKRGQVSRQLKSQLEKVMRG